MKGRTFHAAFGLTAAVLLAAAQIFVIGLAAACAQAAGTSADSKIQAEVASALKKSEFRGVHISVTNGVADLTGTVKNFATKEEADKRVHRIKDVAAVRNELQIAGAGQVPDQKLAQEISQKLAYDRVGYGNAFNAIGVSVRDGVATLIGHALGPVAADSAVSLVSRFPGVTDVIDNIQIDPVSPMDNGLRLRLYRAIYGYPTLDKYAVNPAQPIRIVVENGHVELDGAVVSQADKEAAGIRAQGTPGVLSVTNDLQVVSGASETNNENK